MLGQPEGLKRASDDLEDMEREFREMANELAKAEKRGDVSKMQRTKLLSTAKHRLQRAVVYLSEARIRGEAALLGGALANVSSSSCPMTLGGPYELSSEAGTRNSRCRGVQCCSSIHS